MEQTSRQLDAFLHGVADALELLHVGAGEDNRAPELRSAPLHAQEWSLDFVDVRHVINFEFTTLTDCELWTDQVRVWTNDSLSRSSDHMQHFWRCIFYHRLLLVFKQLNHFCRNILLNEDYIRLDWINFQVDLLNKGFFLIYLYIDVNEKIIVFLNETEGSSK